MDFLFKLSPEHESKSKEEISKLLDTELEKFSEYMSTMGDWKSAGPLMPFEKVLIKSYLVQKLKGTL